MRLLLDEMLDPEIARQLRNRGRDVEAIQADRPELMGLDDDAVLQRCAEMERTLVTDNVKHFAVLHRQWLAYHRGHAGIILAHPASYSRRKQDIGIWVGALDRVMEELESTSRTNLLHWLP